MNLPCYYQISIILFTIAHVTYSLRDAKPAAPGESKYAVVLALVNGACRPYCTGSLISTRHILTAGHCVYSLKEEDLEAIAGIIDWKYNMQGEVRSIETITRHPEYRPGRRSNGFMIRCVLVACECVFGPSQDRLYASNDIAVLTVNQAFPLNDDIGVVELPSSLTQPPYGSRCVFSGWGAGEFSQLLLHWASFRILQPAECRDIALKGELCAESANGITYTESGDSGGPLVCDGVVVGILHIGSVPEELRATFPIVVEHISFIEGALSV